MTTRFCISCGNKIARKIPHTQKKTKSTRKKCYNCSPPVQYHENHKSERRKRKEILVKMLGGHCVECGYCKSLPALSFHHIHPESKKFDMSNGGLMQEWDIVVKEANKCELLCLNCHAELNNGM